MAVDGKRVFGPVVEGLERLTFNQQITVQVRAGLPPRNPEYDDDGPSDAEIDEMEISRLEEGDPEEEWMRRHEDEPELDQ